MQPIKAETNDCHYSLLNRINGVEDLKELQSEELRQLAREMREFIIGSVSKTGGHLASSLGAVDFTIALHYFFQSPTDKVIWDVGHQCYAHKILTGRRDEFHTLRQYKGLSGFPKISESEHDAFGAGHSSTSLSAALGMAKARDIKGLNHEVVAIIGDGALTGGNALEAINQVGYLNTKIILILNDNRMSISENVGALSEYTHRIERTETYQQVKKTLNGLIKQGNGLKEKLIELKSYLGKVGAPGLLFEKLGLNYIGPFDGHDYGEMLAAFERAQKHDGPSLIHLRTVKGKGYPFAEKAKTSFHGVSPFNVQNGETLKFQKKASFTQVFADTLVDIAEKDDSIVGITAAMPDGTGLSKFKQRFPDRFFDVGIAEQHAVVFAAGLARQGLTPVCAIYSTFLQRAYDAIIHDVCLQDLPVIFAIDRAGIVGSDGPTHHGAFDLSYLRHIPNLIVMAPKDEDELRQMLLTATKLKKPVAIRYPKGQGFGVPRTESRSLDIGRCEVARQGDDLTLVSVGTMFQDALKACEQLEEQGINTTLINARFVKPLDPSIAHHIAKTGRVIVLEENTVQGGFGSAILELCQEKGLKPDVEIMGIPDKFIEQGPQVVLREGCGLHYENIVKTGQRLVFAQNAQSEDGKSAYCEVSTWGKPSQVAV